MSQLYAMECAFTSSAATILPTTELALVTTNPIPLDFPNCAFACKGWFQMTTAADATGVRIAVRRGSGITGSLVGLQTVFTNAAAVVRELNIVVKDQVNQVGEQQYTLTVLQSGGAANGALIQAGLEVAQLSG
jgi:hypothetical protein